MSGAAEASGAPAQFSLQFEIGRDEIAAATLATLARNARRFGFTETIKSMVFVPILTAIFVVPDILSTGRVNVAEIVFLFILFLTLLIVAAVVLPHLQRWTCARSVRLLWEKGDFRAVSGPARVEVDAGGWTSSVGIQTRRARWSDVAGFRDTPTHVVVFFGTLSEAVPARAFRDTGERRVLIELLAARVAGTEAKR